MTPTESEPATTAAPGEPTTRRRRGAALEDAILDAAYDELTEVGYTALTVEGVAARARTGKASIYRRWPSKARLVMDALSLVMPTPQDHGFTPSFPDHVTTEDALRHVGEVIVRTMNSTTGGAMRAIKFEATGDPELAELIDQRFQAPRRAAMLALLHRGVERGEVRPEAATSLIADVLPAVLMHRLIMLGERVSNESVDEIMELVMIPLVRAT